MPYEPRVPRIRWIEAGLELLAAGGPGAVRVEAIAAALGVTKGGFYGFFANRAALLGEMLDEWERRSIDEVVDEVEASAGDVRERLRGAGLRTFSSSLLPVDLAVRAWARQDAAIAERLRRVDNARMGYLRGLYGSFVSDLDEIEARSTASFVLAIGWHFLGADHGNRTPGEAAGLAFDRLLLTGLDETKVVTASRIVDAPHEAIFELIADPARQPEWDGNANLAAAPRGQRVRTVGDVFTTVLSRGSVRQNHVVEFEEGRRMAWRPAEPGRNPPGHLWRWQLESLSDTRTLVTHTYNWTMLTDESRRERARTTDEAYLRRSLDRLAALASHSGS